LREQAIRDATFEHESTTMPSMFWACMPVVVMPSTIALSQ
jgi:hypothetical protein